MFDDPAAKQNGPGLREWPAFRQKHLILKRRGRVGGKSKQLDCIGQPVGIVTVMAPVCVLGVVAGQRRQKVGMDNAVAMRAMRVMRVIVGRMEMERRDQKTGQNKIGNDDPPQKRFQPQHVRVFIAQYASIVYSLQISDAVPARFGESLFLAAL